MKKSIFTFVLCAVKVGSRLVFSPVEMSQFEFRSETNENASNPSVGSKSGSGSGSDGQGKTLQLDVALKAAETTSNTKQTQATLTNVFNGLLYNAKVTLGSGQVFEIVLDTGSSDTWFRGSECVNPSNDGSCDGPKVNSSDAALRSMNVNWETNYGIGSVKGQVYEGPLSLGGHNVTIPIGISTFEEGCRGTDGIMGLGFNLPTSSNISAALGGRNANFWDALGFTGSQNVFGFYLSPSSSGQVTLGGIDSSKIKSAPVYFPLLQEATRGYIGWFFDISSASVTIQNSSVTNLGLKGSSELNVGLSDSGTSGILLPTSVSAQINAAIGARRDGGIACSVAQSGPDVVFRMGRALFSVPASIYVYKQPGTSACQSQFLAGAEIAGTAIFGATFLQCFYGVFDKNEKKLGFAELVGGPKVVLGPDLRGGASSVSASALIAYALTLTILLL